MGKYTEKDIKHLSGMKAIRAKPGMYIGPTNSSGIWTLLREAADNTVDEFIAGRNASVHLIAEESKGVTALWSVDEGEGIPVKPIAVEDAISHKKIKISALKAIVSLTHTGGKFGGKAYSGGSRGTHGVGIKATNALSSEFEVWTRRDGKWWYTKYEQGVEKVAVKKAKPPKLPHRVKSPKQGTIVRFVPDLSIFSKGAKLKDKEVLEWCELTSYLNGGFRIFFTGSSGKTKKWFSKKGAPEYLKTRLEALKAESLGRHLVVLDKTLDVALAFSSAEGTNVDAFTNGLRNVDGGVHLDAMYRALAKSLEPYKKRKHKFTPSDLREGLVGIINYKIESPKFSSQTKEKLVDERVGKPCEELLLKTFGKFFKENKSLAGRLCDRATELKKVTDDFRANKKVVRELSAARRKKNPFPLKFLSALRAPPNKRELFLVEGDSAKGTAEMARDAAYQEVLPLKGKILNVHRDEKGKALESEEVMNILKCIGYDPKAKNPIDNLRIGKLLLLPDADVDGSHIGALNLCLLEKYLPDMFAKGMVYLVKAPEFICEHNGKRYLAKSLDEMRKTLPNADLMKQVTHLKGWGEISKEALREIAFDPKTRSLIKFKKLTPKVRKEFRLLMQEDVEYRKKLLGV